MEPPSTAPTTAEADHLTEGHPPVGEGDKVGQEGVNFSEKQEETTADASPDNPEKDTMNQEDDDDDDHEPVKKTTFDDRASTSYLPSNPTIKKANLFHFMAVHPLPFMILLPAAFILLIGFGYSQPDYVEDQVTSIWIPSHGSYAQDRAYKLSLSTSGSDSTSSDFAAMALSRDGGNIFTPARLEEIRARMEAFESVQVQYNGTTFTWDDICASNAAPYQLPCLRLSPLDLFQEARWYFDGPQREAWYVGGIQAGLLKPLVPRFGSMTTACATPSTTPVCDPIIIYRTHPELLGLNISANPLALFADVQNMELSDPCRICIETAYNKTIYDLYTLAQASFQILVIEWQRFLQNPLANNATAQALVQEKINKTTEIMNSLTLEQVDDFYYYYTIRGLYSELGAETYLDGYEEFAPLVEACNPFFGMVCPPANITLLDAKQALLDHADNTFSSVSTAGIPFPFWSSGDGTGYLFGGTFPVSGSGIDMSAALDSILTYIDVTNYQDFFTWSPKFTDGVSGFADPSDPPFVEYVEKNPLYSWFMADMEESTASCGNGNLTGTNLGVPEVDNVTAEVMGNVSVKWCTVWNVPNTGSSVDTSASYSRQYFARMWYDLLMVSDGFLNLLQGDSDPYTWTTGAGCGYTLAGKRDSYTNKSISEVLMSASRTELYNIDEGTSIGPVDRNLLIGGAYPPVGQYSTSNPLQKASVVQNLMSALLSQDIVKRVQHCLRPGGPVYITEQDADEILYRFKLDMEAAWTSGWNDESDGEVAFVFFSDDSGGETAIGTTGVFLKQITLDNTTLTMISIVIIVLFSAVFLVSFDYVESRVLISFVGVLLVCLSFFAALGFGILTGIKINITSAWTLPFIIIGLGVDNIYVVMQALKKQGGYGEHHYLKAMKEVVVPITMTSLVNACMFAVISTSDIPAVYLTARVAGYAVIAIYLATIFSFPSYCYVDLKRQAAGRLDFFFCLKRDGPPAEVTTVDFRSSLLYDYFYLPLILGKKSVRIVTHTLIWVTAIVLLCVGSWGITQRRVGLGLEDFFPSNHQAHLWAETRTSELASWSITMNWGALNYTNPDTQMHMIKQFEGVVSTPHVGEIETKQLWMANFLIWTSRMCTSNVDRPDFGSLACGRDRYHEATQSYCSGSWSVNKYDLKTKVFKDLTSDVCVPYEGGICRPASMMHPLDLLESGVSQNGTESYCPVVGDWSDDKWQYCLVQWRNITGGSDGLWLFEEEYGSPTECTGVNNLDNNFRWPLPYSPGPSMFAFGMYSHELTLEMIRETRALCDDDTKVHCWLTGIPYDYWTQYDGIFTVLTELAGYATLVGFGISFIFLFGKLAFERRHSLGKVFVGCFVGATLIAVTIILSLVTVVGLSTLAGVNLTGFSNMSFVLSVGFSVEYSVHVISRWLRADLSITNGLDRMRYTMSFLMLPTFMSFISSTIGVVCLAFTEFRFNKLYFFRPLMILMLATYFFGCWWLPCLLTYLNFDAIKLGKLPANESFYDTGSQHPTKKDKSMQETQDDGKELNSNYDHDEKNQPEGTPVEETEVGAKEEPPTVEG